MKQNNLSVGKYCLITSDVSIGYNVQIFNYVNLYGCAIGSNTKIGTFVEIQKGSQVGKNCKVSSHTFICEGVHIKDGVFIGHNVTFINDKYPMSTNKEGGLQTEDDWKVLPTIIEDGVSIGSSSTILCGLTIGEGSMVGAGSVVTHDIPANEVWAGNPARYLRLKSTDLL